MDGQRLQADELEDRLIGLGVRVIHLSASLPDTPAGRHIAVQILRSGTSPAPNYAEARGAESRADFKHKLGIVLKELNETLVWLKIIARSEMLPSPRIECLMDETQQLARIITRSIKTIRRSK